MLPAVNQILYIQVASLDEEEAKQEYKSRIADVNGKNISMEIPINVETGRLKRFFTGDQLSVYYISEGGIKNYFNTEVLGFKEDVIRLLMIRKPDPESITKVQRRNYLRVPAELEVAVKVTEHIQFLALTDDVGGGGISFKCDGNAPLKLKDIVSCWLLVHYRNGHIEHVYFKGKLVRINAAEAGKQLVTLGFSEILDSERQKIIRYCFERQLDFRKR